MNRRQLINQVKEDTGVNQVTAEACVERALAHIAGALAHGEKVVLRDFGTFEVVYRAARTGRNPQTGAPVSVPAKHAVKFKPGKALEETVQL